VHNKTTRNHGQAAKNEADEYENIAVVDLESFEGEPLSHSFLLPKSQFFTGRQRFTPELGSTNRAVSTEM
jgi:hypothetical protein